MRATTKAASQVTIVIPTPLRSSTAGRGTLHTAGSTVGEVLSWLVQTYPETRTHVFNDRNESHRWINVYVNGEDIRFTGGLQTPLSADDEVSIIPAIAGGGDVGDRFGSLSSDPV